MLFKKRKREIKQDFKRRYPVRRITGFHVFIPMMKSSYFQLFQFWWCFGLFGCGGAGGGGQWFGGFVVLLFIFYWLCLLCIGMKLLHFTAYSVVDLEL